ncbi:MAG TPA: hypothetical protein VGO56_13690 [Pyrinomonadaceae bacterium]|jgi:hypothetical protein|nr:hypothetical protein [Pyrinomonadaceae bacterium]
MKSLLPTLFWTLLILPQAYSVHAQDWPQIDPLKSTRADVERLLGHTKEAYFALYQLKHGSLFIEYSGGPCRPDRKGGWDVPENVVISISFSPKHPKRLAELKLDPKKFRKVVGGDVVGVEYYVNDEDGITYGIQRGKLDWVEYGPPKKYEHLNCGGPTDQMPRDAKSP